MNIPLLLIGFVPERPKPLPAEQSEPALRAAPRWSRNVDHTLYNAKRCASCEEIKLKTAFHKSSGKRDGRCTRCAACHQKKHQNLAFKITP